MLFLHKQIPQAFSACRDLLFMICYLLLITCYLLLITCYLLPVTHYLLYCLLLIIRYITLTIFIY